MVVYIKEKFKNQQGFTLIEVIVAIVIITALVGTFAPLITGSVYRINWAGKRTQTLYSIRGDMEREMASATGEENQVAIVITGQNADGEDLAWTVNGSLIYIEEVDEAQKIDEFLVSFVVPKQ